MTRLAYASSCVVLIAISLASSPAAARFCYVATGGSDDGPGEEGKPYRTLAKAAGVMKPGDTCIVSKGLYFETVRPPSGTTGEPVTFRAAAGHDVTVCGTAPITGWTRLAPGLYSAKADLKLGKNLQVFFDGKYVDEARWPNVKDADLMTPDAAEFKTGSPKNIVCTEFPAAWTSKDVAGAVAWFLAGSRWTSWSSTVAGYDAKARSVTLEPHDVHDRMDPRRGGLVYLVGKRVFLDAPNEWYYDQAAKTLFLRPPAGADPNKNLVAAKTRRLAFDLSKCSHVRVIGINVRAATFDLTGAEYCLVQGSRAMYISHTRGGRTIWGINEASGIVVTGHHNVIRDCEIAWSVADGVKLGGRNNALINCHIHHIDYMGCYGTPVKLYGVENLVSHNTIHDAGRDCIQPSGQRHILQYNNVYRPGRIAWDLAPLYVAGCDGGGTEIRYNWFHDNLAGHVRCGLYLDNYTHNFLAHHNVMWNTQGDELRLNTPSGCNVIVNNTILGNLGHWGRWKTDRMAGDVLINNLLAGQIKPHADYAISHALANQKTLTPENFTKPPRAAIDAGLAVDAVTLNHAGKAPDIGAYESGRPAWRAGHDFANPPSPVYTRTVTHLRNHLRNACFEDSRYDPRLKATPLAPWKPTRAKFARVVHASGFSESYNTRTSIHANSVHLAGGADDGIAQTVTTLRPNTRYAFWAQVNLAGAKSVDLTVTGIGGKSASVTTTAKQWHLVKVEFTTGPKATSATVTITKQGSGTAHVDDTALMPVQSEPYQGVQRVEGVRQLWPGGQDVRSGCVRTAHRLWLGSH